VGNGALAIGPKLPRPSSTLPQRTSGDKIASIATSMPDRRSRKLLRRGGTLRAPHLLSSENEAKPRLNIYDPLSAAIVRYFLSVLICMPRIREAHGSCPAKRNFEGKVSQIERMV
jgi:hypothetical protein